MEEQVSYLEVLHLMGGLKRAIHRGFGAAVSDCPKCHFPMLQRLHFTIQTYGQEGAVYVSELSRCYHAAPPAVSRDLKTLEREGLIRREADPADRRKTLVRLTPEGDRARRRCEEAVNVYLQGVLNRMGAENVRRIMADLTMAQRIMDEETAARGGHACPEREDTEC